MMGGAENVSPALLLLELGHRARKAALAAELEFLLVNDTRLLLPYRQSILWRQSQGIAALSGVVQPDRNAPYAQWCAKVCAHFADTEVPARVARLVVEADLPTALAAQWREWLPTHAVWLPLVIEGADGPITAGLLLAGPQVLTEERLPLLTEWGRIWSHAWQALQHTRWAWPQWRRQRQADNLRRSWWRRPSVWVLGAVLVLAAWPVHLTVLAPGELVAAQPSVLRAPLDGVVEQIHVQPNEMVKQGQLLFSLDEAQIVSRLEVSEQALLTAEAEYRQFAQLALGDARSKTQLATLAGRIGERRAERVFLAEQRQRARVLAPQDGMVLFDAPSEWVGRPVQTGERVMRIAQPDAVEIEAWVPVGDAIPLATDAPVQLYLAASPFAGVRGRMRYVAYDAVARPDGSYAYRVRAAVEEANGARIGLKGTVKLQGEKAALYYWVLRKPWASIRQWIAL